MSDFLQTIIDNAESFRWIFFIALLWVFYRWMDTDNGLEWRDFFSAKGTDGVYHGDLNKAGQVFGIGASVFVIIAAAPMAYTDFTGFAFLLTPCLGFLGGAAAYAATLRAKVDRHETVTTTEPLPRGPQKVTVTETGPAPAKDAPPLQVEVVNEKPLRVKETPDNPD